MGAVVRLIEPELAAMAEGIGSRHERAGFARTAVGVVGRTHEEVDVGRVEYAPRRQVPRVLLVDPMGREVGVVRSYEGFVRGGLATIRAKYNRASASMLLANS